MEEKTLAGSIIGTLMQGAVYLIELYKYALIARILLSWLPQLQENRFAEFLYKITEPYLALFRRIIPPIGMIDLSPIAAFLVYDILARFLLDGIRTVLLWFV